MSCLPAFFARKDDSVWWLKNRTQFIEFTHCFWVKTFKVPIGSMYMVYLYTYMKNIKINHSCRQIYRSSHGWYGVYNTLLSNPLKKKSPRFAKNTNQFFVRAKWPTSQKRTGGHFSLRKAWDPSQYPTSMHRKTRLEANPPNPVESLFFSQKSPTCHTHKISSLIILHPPKSNIDTKHDGFFPDVSLLSNMAILDIYVKFQGCTD